MKKQFGGLYSRICHPGNLWMAYRRAARGKRHLPAAAAYEYDLERNLIELEQDLLTETYLPGPYHTFQIGSPKRRLISAAPFRDRVVHHALMNIIEPLFERQFIHDSYANRIGKGTHAALDRCTHFLRRYPYVMHCDVCKFFPSIDHQILTTILGRTVADPQAMNLVQKIIASGTGIQTGEYEMVYFPEDDLLAACRPRGLPIGNLTSQHWANVYLNDLDQFVKRRLKIQAYLRYVDDLLIFANDKATLHIWLAQIIEFLRTLRLTLHESRAQPRPSWTGVTFLGFQVFPDHRRLKPANGYGFRRRYRAMLVDGMDSHQMSMSVQSWVNHASHGDTWGLRQSILSTPPQN